jgi:hypothetical protein
MSYELLRLVARKFDEHTSSGIRLGTPTSDSADPDSDNRGRRSPSISSKYLPGICLSVHLSLWLGGLVAAAGCAG